MISRAPALVANEDPRSQQTGSRLQTLHDLSMRFQDPVALVRTYFEGPVIVIKCAAQNDSVAAGEHVAPGQITVVNFGLWNQHLELATHRTESLIVEQRAGAETRAVEDDRLRQAHDLFTSSKLFDHDTSPGDVEIAQQR